MSETRQLRVALLGNAVPAWSTENEFIDAFERCGHSTTHFQEGDLVSVTALCEDVRHRQSEFDLVIWIRTPELAKQMGEAVQWRLIAACQKAGIPLVGVHLDRWWGLEREQMVFQDPYFQVDILLTADGGHDHEWESAGVRHRWLPPAISERWCQPGRSRRSPTCDVLFVGSWRHYHPAWTHRMEMVEELSRVYGSRFKTAPRSHHPRITGLDLNDYYWSTKVVVGDSCLVPKKDGSPMTHYCSDRVPETLGRGGVLVHPRVEGLPFVFTEWELGDFNQMRKVINEMIAIGDDERSLIRQRSMERILDGHTYTHRVGELIAILEQEGLL